MSWDLYVQNLETDRKVVKYAALCGKEPLCIWGKSAEFNITVEEIKKLFGDSKHFTQCGPIIGGYKCRMLRDCKNIDGIYSIDFKTSQDAEGNAYNINVGYTITGLVIAVGTKEATGGQVSAKVYDMNKYLRDNNL